MNDRPLSGRWRYNNGFLCCGTLRIARIDFDNNSSEEFKQEVFDWMCQELNEGLSQYNDPKNRLCICGAMAWHPEQRFCHQCGTGLREQPTEGEENE